MSTEERLFPLVSADVALFTVDQDKLQVLLVQRAQEPEKGLWGLPGAVLKPTQDPDLEATARRALKDKISVEVPCLEQVRVFSGADRDPRGWSLAVLFCALLPRDQIHAVIRNKVEAVEWKEVRYPGVRMAFDHPHQIETALTQIRQKVERHQLPLQLMPEKFTLTELQRTCEAVLERPLDKSVFRRRLKDSAEIIELSGEYVLGPQRPAQLFAASPKFKH